MFASIKNHSRTRTHRHQLATLFTWKAMPCPWHCHKTKLEQVLIGWVICLYLRDIVARRVNIVALETQHCILYVMLSYMWKQCENIERCATLIRQRYSILRCYGRRAIFLSVFNEIWMFSTNFHTSLQHLISRKIRPVGSRADRCRPKDMAKLMGASHKLWFPPHPLP